MKEKFYITTAIAYTSRKPHIGNTYEIVFTDAIARFKRMIGKDVFFLTGSDEHGIKIQEYAEKEGIAPKAYVDRVAGEIKGIWDLMNTSYDKFIRTTDEQHERVVTKIFTKLYEQGDIYKGEYSGWYCTPCETFYTQTQLNDGKCPDCGAQVKETKEEAYFFKMSKYQKRLEEHIEANPDFITPESRKKEMINNFLKPGLSDLCVSRTSFTWGIPVEFDPKHVIYVWIDALSNYITAMGYDVDEKGDLYRRYWPCDVHIIGKDILRFHTIYWPIILMALGEELPKQVFAHPWFLAGFDKMSKSKGNTIYADELSEYVGVDGVRYYLISEMPYAQDGMITYENVIKKYNAELANNLGNLVSRTLAMTKKYFGGVVPCRGELNDTDKDLLATAEAQAKLCYEKMEQYRAAEAIDCVFEILHRANKYIDETEPWVLAKTEEGKKRLETVIYNLLDVIRFAAIHLFPFLPETAQKIAAAFGVECKDWKDELGVLEAGKAMGECPMLFARLDEEKLLNEIHEKQMKAQEPVEEKKEIEHLEEIGIDDFFKCELRCGKVLECEKIKKSKKLLKLKVDMGDGVRQIVSGIALYYSPEEMIGKKVIVVANLKKAVLCGEESFGMILAGGDEDVKVVFLDDAVEVGSRIS
ncbi:MAG: methionine--tRNA ligase [Ruminococcaceae bacterium]|nr:methionine--tRNA ligase [Oscillospiraceae bacterium]